MWDFLQDWQTWVLFLGASLFAVFAALVCHYLLVKILSRLAKRSTSPVDELLIKHFRRPVRWIMAAVALRLTVEPFELPEGMQSLVRTAFGMVLILSLIHI